MKSIAKILTVGVSMFFLTAFTTKSNEVNNVDLNETKNVSLQATTNLQNNGYIEVSWSVDCNGKNYSGSRLVKSENAFAFAQAILSAPCP